MRTSLVTLLAISLLPGAGAARSLIHQASSAAAGRVLIDEDLWVRRVVPTTRTEFCDTTYADGGYSVRNVAASGCRLFIRNLGDNPRSLRIEVSTRLVSGVGGAESGLYFGVNPDQTLSYLSFLDSLGRHQIDRVLAGKRVVLFHAPGTSGGRLGSTNRLAVEINGRQLRTHVNGRFLGEVTSPTPVQGRFGFFVAGLSARAVFTDLRVTDLGGPAR